MGVEFIRACVACGVRDITCLIVLPLVREEDEETKEINDS